MRHASIDLTMNDYTDPKLLDVQGELQSLPALAITQQDSCVALIPGNVGRVGAITDKPTPQHRDERESPTKVVSGCENTKKSPLPWADNERQIVERKGVEPSTSALRTQRSPN